MRWYFLIPFAVFCVTLSSLVFFLARERRDPVSHAFVIFLAVINAWVLSSIPLYFYLLGSIALPLLKGASIAWLSVGFVVLNFFYALFKKKKDFFYWFFLILLIVSITSSLTTDLIISGYTYYWWGVWNTEGPLYITAVLSNIGLPVTYSLYLILKQVQKTAEKRERQQLLTIMIGLGVTLLIGLALEFLFPVLFGRNVIRFSPSSNIFLAVFIFYAVVRFNFLNPGIKDAATDLFTNLGDGVVLIDREGAILQINQAARKILALRNNDVGDIHLKEIIPEYDFKANYKDFETVAATLEGIRNLLITQSPVVIKKYEVGKLGIIKDITERKALTRELNASLKKLKSRNDYMEEELKMAQVIHQGLLPSKPPVSDLLKVEFANLPLDSIGGDYFNFVNLNEGGFSAFLGDVSGHGVSAALFISLLKSMTDSLHRVHALAPETFMVNLNNSLYKTGQPYFITAIYGLFTSDESGDGITFVFTSGGHPGPILDKKEGRAAELLNARGTLLGAFENVEYTSTRVSLKKGDRLFFYTDGLPETMNVNRDLLGFDELPSLVHHTRDLDLKASVDHIINEIHTFRGATPLNDDIVVIGIEIA